MEWHTEEAHQLKPKGPKSRNPKSRNRSVRRSLPFIFKFSQCNAKLRSKMQRWNGGPGLSGYDGDGAGCTVERFL